MSELFDVSGVHHNGVHDAYDEQYIKLLQQAAGFQDDDDDDKKRIIMNERRRPTSTHSNNITDDDDDDDDKEDNEKDERREAEDEEQKNIAEQDDENEQQEEVEEKKEEEHRSAIMVDDNNAKKCFSKSTTTTTMDETSFVSETGGYKIPKKNAILSGRGYNTNQHEANIVFRHIIAIHAANYHAAKRGEKKGVCYLALKELKEVQGYCFMKRCQEDGLWYDITSEKEQFAKVQQGFRDVKKRYVQRVPLFASIVCRDPDALRTLEIEHNNKKNDNDAILMSNNNNNDNNDTIMDHHNNTTNTAITMTDFHRNESEDGFRLFDGADLEKDDFLMLRNINNNTTTTAAPTTTSTSSTTKSSSTGMMTKTTTTTESKQPQQHPSGLTLVHTVGKNNPSLEETLAKTRLPIECIQAIREASMGKQKSDNNDSKTTGDATSSQQKKRTNPCPQSSDYESLLLLSDTDYKFQKSAHDLKTKYCIKIKMMHDYFLKELQCLQQQLVSSTKHHDELLSKTFAKHVRQNNAAASEVLRGVVVGKQNGNSTRRIQSIKRQQGNEMIVPYQQQQKQKQQSLPPPSKKRRVTTAAAAATAQPAVVLDVPPPTSWGDSWNCDDDDFSGATKAGTIRKDNYEEDDDDGCESCSLSAIIDEDFMFAEDISPSCFVAI